MQRTVFYLFMLLAFFSCSVDDGNANYIDFYEFVPIESVEMPEEMNVNNTYEIILNYIKPSTCYIFHDIFYEYESGLERNVAVICGVLNSNGNCEAVDDTTFVTSFNFRPATAGNYVFTFWQGEDEDGENVFLTVEVPVYN